jgi:hypothetical protein
MGSTEEKAQFSSKGKNRRIERIHSQTIWTPNPDWRRGRPLVLQFITGEFCVFFITILPPRSPGKLIPDNDIF